MTCHVKNVFGFWGFLRRQSKSEGSVLSSGPFRKQNFTSTGSKGHGLWFGTGGLRSVLCAFVALNFRVHLFLKSMVGLPALCLVDRGDLCFDVLLWKINFSHFSSHVFLPPYRNMASLDSQGEIVPIELPNPEETQVWEGENKSVHSRQHFNFVASARYCCLYSTSKDWMLW